MHTENTEIELSVFSGCIFSVAGMCTGRTKISPNQSTLSNRFSRMNQSNFGIQVQTSWSAVQGSRFLALNLEP